ncbi:uncharacterized protein METZ01_LOCUS255612, partial [marine metagenome]
KIKIGGNHLLMKRLFIHNPGLLVG